MSLVERVRAILPPRYREFAKFLIVGGTAWVVDAGIFTLLSHTILDHKVITSKIISVLISIMVSYVLNREWSFNTRGGRELHHEALLFFLVNGFALGINLIPLAVSHYLIGINVGNGYTQLTTSIADWISANVIGTAIAMFFRYWAYRRYVFPNELGEVDASEDRRDPGDGRATSEVHGFR